MYPHFGQTPPSTPHLSAEHDGYIIFLDPTRLDDGGGIRVMLRKSKAQYHRSCCLMFNNTKLESVRKREAENTQSVEY